MNKLLLGSLSLAMALAFSGCGDDAKSIEELQKLSKDELEAMNKACEAVKNPAISKLGGNPSESELIKAEESDSKLAKERKKITNDILQARGIDQKIAVADFTNEEVSKFGNSDFAKYVECARVVKTLNGIEAEEIKEQNKARRERYQKLVDELGK